MNILYLKVFLIVHSSHSINAYWCMNGSVFTCVSPSFLAAIPDFSYPLQSDEEGKGTGFLIFLVNHSDWIC